MPKTAENDRERRPAGPMNPAHRAERAAELSVHACLALLLLTPLVWSPDTYFPFAVGKAVYARSLIAVSFALWALLALARPRWRPPRTVFLAVLAAGLAVDGLSAWAGVSPQRSLWSTYTRMEGLVTTVHWVALFVVLAGTVRTRAGWTRLLKMNVAVGLAVALITMVRFHLPDLPLFGLPSEARYPRVSATTGNPTFLGGYLVAVALLAAGFLVRSFMRPVGGQAAWTACLPWALTAPAAVYALVLTGSLGALAGLGAGAVAAAGLYAWLGPTARARRTGRRALLALGGAGAVLAVGIAVRASAPPPATDVPARAFETVMLERATSAERIGMTMNRRFRNWESGLKAFAERPLLGWGTGNYFVGSARHISEPDGPQLVRDHAHNMLVEEAASKGVFGLAAYLALWGWTFVLLIRAARAAGPRDQALLIVAAAALLGWFVQTQSLFYSATNWLQQILLLGFAAHWEARLRAGDGRTRRWAAAPLRALRDRAARIAAGALVLAAAAGSLASSRAVHAGAAALHRAEHEGEFLADMERSVDAFAPLANGPRVILINNVAANWPVLSRDHAAEADRLLAWMEAEAPAALAAEPESWVVHHALTRLYRAVAATEPGYAERAERHHARSLELAPNLDPLEPPLQSPRAR
ncbi:MAG: O-antigen ligase family protein [Gemmatimonadetes bacterium]|nr:O-antigen ligase family protein [Gemmatimonadota bacterium]